MSDGRKPKFKEPMQDVELAKMKLEVESEAKPETPLTAEEIYLKRKTEVAQQDNEDFSDYLRQRAARDQQQAPQAAAVPQTTATPANRAAETQSAKPPDLGRGHRSSGRGGHARLSHAHRAEHPGSRSEARRRHLYRAPAPPHRSRIGQSPGGCGRPTLRRLGAADADQDERRH